VTVRASGLPPGATVTLATELRRDEERMYFTSTSKFVTSGEGLLDTGRQAPLEGGSYHGAHRSGALWSVRPEPGSVSRLWPEDITRPLHYSLALRDPAGHTLCRAQVWRGYTAPGVRRVEVREAGLVGTLFLPEAAGPAPAIITLYGGVNRGRVPEDRAALLASRGFVTLALAFFGVDGMPEVYNDIEVEYFEAAIRWLVARPEVAGSSVGLCGISKVIGPN
jgi:dipeptidyl aminopeptidase/acylaminoacyl peptidase